MGMSTHVVGFRPPDEKWKQMKAAYDACVAAHVGVPEDVRLFFEYKEPSDLGVEVQIPNALRRYSADMKDGYEVDLKKVPKDVTVIRFYNSH